ncbi:MAG: Calx-beta domain-containing protein [Actinomycetota bacterium]
MGRILALTAAVLLATGLPGAGASPTLGKAAEPTMSPTGRVRAVSGALRGPATGPSRRGQEGIELLVPDPAAVEAEKEAASSTAPGEHQTTSGASPGGPRAAVFNGLNQPGIPAGSSTPPDATGAVGPNDYIEMVNSEIRIYSRDLTTVQDSKTLGEFIEFPADSVFDPQIQWDQQAGRFLFVMDDIDPVFGNFLAIGWSKTANPGNLDAGPLASEDWCVDFIPTGDFDDYPKLGHNDTHMLVGTNVFDEFDDYVGARLWAVPKPAPGSTTCPSTLNAFFWAPLTAADGDFVFTPVPANTFGPSPNGYVAAADFATGDSEIMVWHVSGPAAAPVLTEDGEIGVSTYDFPANVPQPGTTNVLDSLDARLTQAVAAPDPGAGGAMAVWTQHTIDGAGGRSVVRWYELVPAAVTPKRQEGTISNASHFVFNGAISPAASGSDAVINYNVGSATLNAEIRAQSRTGATTLGTMEGEITLGASVAFDQDFTCTDPGGGPPCRWGDYAGASPDPLYARVVWGSNQAIGTSNADNPHWVTRNFALATAAGEDRVLWVTVSGSGTGTVSGPGIGCPGDCSEIVSNGTAMSLSATATGASTFQGWGGDCSGSASCDLTLNENRYVTATFDAPPPPPPPAPPPPPPPPTPPTLSLSSAKAKEGKPAIFTVTRTGDLTQALGVPFATANGTAKALKDYKPASGTLSFAPGEASHQVKVKTKNDKKDEKNEKFSLKLTVGTNTFSVGVKIKDND